MRTKLQIRLTDHYHNVLSAAAEREDCSVSELIRDWIRELPTWKPKDLDEDSDDV